MQSNVNAYKCYPWKLLARGLRLNPVNLFSAATMSAGTALMYSRRASCNYVNLDKYFNQGFTKLQLQPFVEKMSGGAYAVGKFGIVRYRAGISDGERVAVCRVSAGGLRLSQVGDPLGNAVALRGSSYYPAGLTMSSYLSVTTDKAGIFVYGKANANRLGRAYLEVDWKGANGIGVVPCSTFRATSVSATIGLLVTAY